MARSCIELGELDELIRSNELTRLVEQIGLIWFDGSIVRWINWGDQIIGQSSWTYRSIEVTKADINWAKQVGHIDWVD